MNMTGITRRWALAGLAFIACSGACLAAEPSLRLDPKRIEMTSFYSGAKLRIEGAVAGNTTPIVVIRGDDTEVAFNRKARFGVVWANAGKVRISGVPSVFFCFSPKPVRRILGPGEVSRWKLDEAAIKEQMHLDPEQSQQTAAILRSDYVALKSADRLYQTFPDGLHVQQGAAETSFWVEFHWPKRAVPASYRISVLECRDGAVIQETSLPLQVVKIGFPETLAVMANNQAALYGFLSVLMAVAAGFGIDFLSAKLFGRGRARAAH